MKLQKETALTYCELCGILKKAHAQTAQFVPTRRDLLFTEAKARTWKT